MASILVADRQTHARFVASAGREFADRIAVRCQAMLSPLLPPGAVLPDLALAIHLSTQAMEEKELAMSEADQRNELELNGDATHRHKRDEAVATLRATMVAIRKVIASLYSADTVAHLGLVGNTPEDATLLVRFANQLRNTAAAITLPPPRIEGASLDLGPWLTRIEREVAAVEAAQARVADEVRKASATLVDKDRAIAAFDEQYRYTANLIAGMLAGLGEGELASRVRPKEPSRAAAAVPSVVVPTVTSIA